MNPVCRERAVDTPSSLNAQESSVKTLRSTLRSIEYSTLFPSFFPLSHTAHACKSDYPSVNGKTAKVGYVVIDARVFSWALVAASPQRLLCEKSNPVQ
mmetsp:Transcript_8602/g.22474  ORF Transcript_8602/g.22474 Transcript_8602/m.22474 type:complete len:98 (-) Transcript_8602:18-311(-)